MSNDEKEYKLVPYEPEDPEDQIHLSDLFFSIWDHRKLIAVITSVFIIYGVLLSLSITEQFTSTTTMMPNIEQRTQLPSALQQFSGLLGGGGGVMQQGPSGDEINMLLYPDIIYSTPAMYNLIYEEVDVPNIEGKVTVKDYMLEHQTPSTLAKVTGTFLKYTVHLPVTILSGLRDLISWVFSGKTVDEQEFEEVRQQAASGTSELPGAEDTRFRLTYDEWNFMSGMEDRIKTNYVTDTGLFSVEVHMPDPEVSAQVAESIIGYLTEYIIEYRTERLVRNLRFIEERYEEIEDEFLEAQKTLAEFRDRNLNLATARAMSEERRLESEYQLKFDLYNGIAQQKEDAKFQLMQETPVFKVLEPVSVPTTRSSPQRALMVILFAFLGGFVSLFYIYVKSRVLPMFRRRTEK